MLNSMKAARLHRRLSSIIGAVSVRVADGAAYKWKLMVCNEVMKKRGRIKIHLFLAT